MASYLHRTATTEYLCCVPTLEDFSGAGRVGLAAANVQLFYYIPNFLREMFKKNSNTPSPSPLYLDLHSHTQYASADTLVIRNQYPLTADPTLPFSVGIHPWFLDNWQAQLDAVATLASHPNCWAIGECGIDKNTSTPLPLQQQIFTEQIAIAEALQKPLIIHCVKAYSEVVALRQRTHARQLWVLHGFRKNLLTAQALLSHGIALSFGAALLRDQKLQQVFQTLYPHYRDYFFFETDDAELNVKTLYQFADHLKATIQSEP